MQICAPLIGVVSTFSCSVTVFEPYCNNEKLVIFSETKIPISKQVVVITLNFIAKGFAIDLPHAIRKRKGYAVLCGNASLFIVTMPNRQQCGKLITFLNSTPQ